MLKAARIAISMPNSTNAMKMDSTVKIVRIFLRNRLRQTMGRNFMRPPPTRARPSRGAVCAWRAPPRRVVRHHDDGLAVIAIERLEEIENLVAGLAIEVARRLVAEEQRRIGHDRARDADALFLAAGQLTREVIHAVAKPDDRQRTSTRLRRSALPSLVSSSGSSTFRAARQHGQQVVELEHEADVAGAPRRQFAPGQLVDAVAAHADRAFRRRIEPPSRLSSVVLPEPDGPMSARKSPSGISSVTPCRTSMRSPPR